MDVRVFLVVEVDGKEAGRIQSWKAESKRDLFGILLRSGADYRKLMELTEKVYKTRTDNENTTP